MNQHESKILDAVEKFFVIIFLLTIPLFSFFCIDHSFWLDEAYSYFGAAKSSISEVITGIKNDISPILPLYYLILHFWIKIFGISEASIRSLSGMFYILSLPLVYYLGMLVYKDKKTAAVCSFLFMISPIIYRNSQNARTYSLLAFVCILSTIFFLKLVLNNPCCKKDLAFFMLISSIGTFTHYWYFFYYFSQAIYLILFFRKEDKPVRITFLLSSIPFWILWTPTLISQSKSAADWSNKATIYDFLETIFGFYGYVDSMNWSIALLVYIGCFVICVIKVEDDSLKLDSFSKLKLFILERSSLNFFILFFISLVVPFIISQQIKSLFVPHRYTIIGVLPVAMFLGGLISKFSNKLVLIGFCYMLLFIYVGAFVNRSLDPIRYLDTDRTTSEYLINKVKDNDILVFTSYSEFAIKYYLILFKSDKKLTTVSYPTHFITSERALQNRTNVEIEAEVIGLSIRNLLNEHKAKVWLFYGYDLELNSILKKQLDKNLRQVEEIPLKGSFFNRVLVYEAR